VSILISIFFYFYGYLFVHSFIYLLLIVAPMYFFLEKNNAFESPNMFLIIVYLVVNSIYHAIVINIVSAKKTKKSDFR
jgi:hypothetical protein